MAFLSRLIRTFMVAFGAFVIVGLATADAFVGIQESSITTRRQSRIQFLHDGNPRAMTNSKFSNEDLPSRTQMNRLGKSLLLLGPRETDTSSSTGDKQTDTWTNLFRFGSEIQPEMPNRTNATTKKSKKQKRPTTPLAELEDSPSAPAINLSSPETIFAIAAVAGLAIIAGAASSLGLTSEAFLHGIETLLTNPQDFFQDILDFVKDLGPTGAIYFALIYMVAEILAIPATPLTLSAGYLFGAKDGILAVLVGATGAACVGFWISRTFLRDYVESTLLAPSESLTGKKGDNSSNSNTLIKLDKAIGKEGFKLLILIRLSPIFPFSVTNYLYGASSIDFAPYLLGTLIGFVPSTSAYVYTGMVGQALTVGQGGDQPWYIYAGGFGVLATLLKLVTDVATDIIEAIDDET